MNNLRGIKRIRGRVFDSRPTPIATAHGGVGTGIDVGDFVDRPDDGEEGELFFPIDGDKIYFWDSGRWEAQGTSFVPCGNGGVTGVGWVQQEGATVDNDQGFLRLTRTNNTSGSMSLYELADFDGTRDAFVTFWMRPVFNGATPSQDHAGIVLYNTTGTNGTLFGYIAATALTPDFYWIGYTQLNTGYTDAINNGAVQIGELPLAYRVFYDFNAGGPGQGRITRGFVSYDGVTFIEVTAPTTAFFGGTNQANKIGFAVCKNSAGLTSVSAALLAYCVEYTS